MTPCTCDPIKFGGTDIHTDDCAIMQGHFLRVATSIGEVWDAKRQEVPFIQRLMEAEKAKK